MSTKGPQTLRESVRDSRRDGTDIDTHHKKGRSTGEGMPERGAAGKPLITTAKRSRLVP